MQTAVTAGGATVTTARNTDGYSVCGDLIIISSPTVGFSQAGGNIFGQKAGQGGTFEAYF